MHEIDFRQVIRSVLGKRPEDEDKLLALCDKNPRGDVDWRELFVRCMGPVNKNPNGTPKSGRSKGRETIKFDVNLGIGPNIFFGF